MPNEIIELFRMPLFCGVNVHAQGVDESIWDRFDRERLHCIVIESEHASHDISSIGQLHEKIEDALINKGDRIWESFYNYWNCRQLIDGSIRMLKNMQDLFDRSYIVCPVIPVREAFRNQEALLETVRGIVQADLAFFDLTRFEPGVMFLLGIRAASRRGVTICSHGYGWREGQKLDIPFNLSDLQVFSHNTQGPGIER